MNQVKIKLIINIIILFFKTQMLQINWPFENILINGSFLFLFITMICYWLYLGSFFKNTFLKLGKFGTILSNLTIFTSLILRWLNSGHFPLSNRATSKQ